MRGDWQREQREWKGELARFAPPERRAPSWLRRCRDGRRNPAVGVRARQAGRGALEGREHLQGRLTGPLELRERGTRDGRCSPVVEPGVGRADDERALGVHDDFEQIVLTLQLDLLEHHADVFVSAKRDREREAEIELHPWLGDTPEDVDAHGPDDATEAKRRDRRRRSARCPDATKVAPQLGKGSRERGQRARGPPLFLVRREVVLRGHMVMCAPGAPSVNWAQGQGWGPRSS